MNTCFFFGVMLGPYITSRGTRSIEMSANADLNTVETYIKLHIKIWKQSDKDFLSYHENDEVSADAAAA